MNWKSFKWLFCAPFFLIGCTNKQLSENEVYEYLHICFDDYYKNYEVEATSFLNHFERFLVAEKYLADTTGMAYKNLFTKLEKDVYFQGPFTFPDSNAVLLYRNPSQLFDCATSTFHIDSTEIAATKFGSIDYKISQELATEEEVSIHYFFTMYKNELSNEDYRKPYVKQSILLFLYRWYFASKSETSEA